jgi:outer membrane protein assembly factor BamB
MLEHKTVSHQAMKAKGKSLLDSGNLTANQSLDAAQEMMNDSRREETGGVAVEDVSTYQVTLHRLFEKGVPDWTGEVTGPPKLFPLKTVDVLAAGPNIIVLDKSNKKLWEAKLTFPVANSFSSERVPAVETADALYFADLGMLTRFDLKTGEVKWRYNTVGISKVQAGPQGDIYLDTTTAGPESIQYSQQIDLKNQIHSLVVKVAPATGKELWRAESSGDDCIMSGKFIYSTRQKQSFAALRLEEGPDTHFFLHLLDPGNGSEIWTYHRVNHQLVKLAIQKNWIMVHFRDQVVVMKFFSL